MGGLDLNGIFITFEGPDGAGKTTQLKILAERLQSYGQQVVVTREPGGTVISDQIRALLLNPEHKEMMPQAEVLLYAASRAQLVNELIKPALAEGYIVLCDRYVDASIAYQSVGLHIDRSVVESINYFATGGLTPHRTYLIDIDPSTSHRRLLQRRGGIDLDRIEQRTEDYHQRVREAFLELAGQYPDRFLKVEGKRLLEQISEEIWGDFEYVFKIDEKKGGV
jgi:dTMP kinase